LIFAREVGAINNAAYRNMNLGDTLEASARLRRLRAEGLLHQKRKGSATYYVPSEVLLEDDADPGHAGQTQDLSSQTQDLVHHTQESPVSSSDTQETPVANGDPYDLGAANLMVVRADDSGAEDIVPDFKTMRARSHLR